MQNRRNGEWLFVVEGFFVTNRNFLCIRQHAITIPLIPRRKYIHILRQKLVFMPPLRRYYFRIYFISSRVTVASNSFPSRLNIFKSSLSPTSWLCTISESGKSFVIFLLSASRMISCSKIPALSAGPLGKTP